MELRQYGWCMKSDVLQKRNTEFLSNWKLPFAFPSICMWWEFWYFRITQYFSGMVNAITHWLSLVKSLQFDKTDTEFQDGFVNSSSKWPEVEMIWRREILFLCWVQILTMSHNWEEKMKSQSSIALKLKIIVVGREQMPFFDKIFWSGYTHNKWRLASLIESGEGGLIAICPILAPLSVTSLAPLSGVQFQGLYFTKPKTITWSVITPLDLWFGRINFWELIF